MIFRKLFLSALLAGFLVPGISATNPEVSDKARPPGAAADNPATTLKQGMPAGAVRKLLGEPTETKPMKAPNGKAEVWVYVREISRRAEQMRVATPDVVINTTESDGTVRQHVTPGQVTFHDVQYLTEETTEVLMFNDHFLAQKSSRQERKL